MIVLTSATHYLKNKWLSSCSIYVTIEPCSMCAGALVLARIKHLIYGADDPKTGACGSVFDITRSRKLNHRLDIKRGILENDCAFLLKEFFKKKRK
jgi:tRNA(adenine34) deaminase